MSHHYLIMDADPPRGAGSKDQNINQVSEEKIGSIYRTKM